jgi:pimeloyl-ACP methyl ester carboxylesterase
MCADQHVVLPDGLRISYAETGVPDGQVVLYFHGTPGPRGQVTGPLDAVATELGLRLVAPDRPAMAVLRSALWGRPEVITTPTPADRR